MWTFRAGKQHARQAVPIGFPARDASDLACGGTTGRSDHPGDFFAVESGLARLFRSPSSVLRLPLFIVRLPIEASGGQQKSESASEDGSRKSEVGTESERGKLRAEVAGGARASTQELEPFCLFLAV
jgi:hypothetical protein